MINWIKKKLGITALEQEAVTSQRAQLALSRELEQHRKFVTRTLNELKEYTRVDADVGYRGNNTIILTGVYRNQAYVRFYDMGESEFRQLVEQLKHMQRHALIRHIDAPHDFRGTFQI